MICMKHCRKKLQDRPHGSRSFSPRQFISGFAPDGVDPGIPRSVATRTDRNGGRREFIHRIVASGGIIFRFADGRYYLIRAIALEDDFNLYYSIEAPSSRF